MLNPLSNFLLGLCCERPGGFNQAGAVGRLGGISDWGHVHNFVIRRNTMTRYVWSESRADDRLIVEVTNVSNNNLQDRIFVCWLVDNLAEAGTEEDA